MSKLKRIHPKVSEKELIRVADQITSKIVNNRHLSNEKLSSEVRRLLSYEQFRKRTYRVKVESKESKEQEQIN